MLYHYSQLEERRIDRELQPHHAFQTHHVYSDDEQNQRIESLFLEN